jgi:hypothetical protein
MGCILPILSGWLTRALGPHHRLIALYEGASAPALFCLLAKDVPF